MAPRQEFEKDEKVLCFHHELLYEAKVLDVRQEDDDDKRSPWLYKVHYKGWKNTWDDWVNASRLRKCDELNIELAKNLKKEIERANHMTKTSAKAAAANSKSKKAGSTRLSEERATPQQVAGKKRVRDAETERVDDWRDKPQVRLPFPDILKSILVDDWENVTWLNQMVPLPSQHSVSELLDDYRSSHEQDVVPGSVQAAILDEMTQGVREYFNLALPRILLYKQERRQYSDIRKRMNTKGDKLHEKSVHQVYGAEHFLRLMTMMPELICQTNLDAQSINKLRAELINMLMWLAQKSSINKYFSVPYVDNTYLEEHERNGPNKHESTAGEA